MLASEEIRRRMHQEHRTLRALQEDLLDRFEAFADEPSEDTHAELVEVFEHFRASLVRHFEFEEADGYLQVVVERRPHHQTRVNELRAEHDAIREVLGRLDGELRSDIMTNVPRYGIFKKDFVELMTVFGRHEQAERELVMETFWLEGGVSD